MSYNHRRLAPDVLFSATYLMSVFPGARCAIYPEMSLERGRQGNPIDKPHKAADRRT